MSTVSGIEREERVPGGTRGGIVVVSGPSGSGKTSVVTELLRDPRFTYSISATTRAPRGAEVHGRDYLFISEPEFRRGIAEGRFLEWAEVYGRLYGTPREPLERLLADGRFVVLNIDVQGAARLREQGLCAAFVFLRPPTLEELERRLRGRRTDDESTIARRLARAKLEMDEAPKYDRIIVNDDRVRAATELRVFVLERAGVPGAPSTTPAPAAASSWSATRNPSRSRSASRVRSPRTRRPTSPAGSSSAVTMCTSS
jgi:guanylate kinase